MRTSHRREDNSWMSTWRKVVPDVSQSLFICRWDVWTMAISCSSLVAIWWWWWTALQGNIIRKKSWCNFVLHESCFQRVITFDIASLSCSSKWLTRNYRFSTKRQTKGIFTRRRENSELYGWLDVNLQRWIGNLNRTFFEIAVVIFTIVDGSFNGSPPFIINDHIKLEIE